MEDIYDDFSTSLFYEVEEIHKPETNLFFMHCTFELL